MYVDSHQHFWKLSRGDYSWMTPDMKKLYKDFFPSDLEPLIKEKNISKTIIVQAADTVAETEFTLKLAEDNEFVAGVVGWIDLESSKTKETIDKLCESKFFKGIRPMIHDIENDEWMLQDNLNENIRKKISNLKKGEFSKPIFTSSGFLIIKVEDEKEYEIEEKFKEAIISKIPSSRLGEPEDVANVVLFLASDQSNYINGETIHVNGGMYMA